MVSFSLRQVTSLVPREGDAPLYRVTNEITEAVGASASVFVYKTVSQKFDHVATVGELEEWPSSYAEAVSASKMFYRLASETRDWETAEEMELDLATALRRVTSLANGLTKHQAAVVIDRTTVIEGA